MGIFKFRKHEETRRTLSDISADMIDETNALVKDLCKICGVDLMDAFGELTEDSGAAVGRCMESYKRLMDLSAEAVAVQDRLEKKIDDLTVRQLKTNEMLMKICESMS